MSKTLNNTDEVMAQQPVLYSDEELVTVAEFPEPASANVARASLEAANIPVFMQGENANSLLPIAFEARLQVSPRDEAEARRILAEFEAQPNTFTDTGMDEGDEPSRRGVDEL